MIRMFLAGLATFGAWLFWSGCAYYFNRSGINVPGIEVSSGVVVVFLTACTGLAAWNKLGD